MPDVSAGAVHVRRAVVMGAAGRDFHDFLVALRDDPTVEVVAFTATQIPGIDSRRFPAELAGPRYPDGIPIFPESELPRLVREHAIDEVLFAYSDVAHVDLMHKASLVLSLRRRLQAARPDGHHGPRPPSRSSASARCARASASPASLGASSSGCAIGAEGRRHPPPDAVPRPERDARRALRERGRPRRASA